MSRLGREQCVDNWRAQRALLSTQNKAKKVTTENRETQEEDSATAIALFAEDFVNRVQRLMAANNIIAPVEAIDKLSQTSTSVALNNADIVIGTSRGGILSRLVNAILAVDDTLRNCRGEIAAHLRSSKVSE